VRCDFRVEGDMPGQVAGVRCLRRKNMDEMDEMRYIIAMIFVSFGLWIFIVNWRIFWIQHIKKKETSSWTPFLAGVLLCLAFKSVSWVVLGSIPVGLGVGAGRDVFNSALLA